MIGIESQLQKRFVELTSVHNALKLKCVEISKELEKIKEDNKDPYKLDQIKAKAQIFIKIDGMTTNELFASIDLISDDSLREETIKKYENYSVYSIKYIVSVFLNM